MMRKTPANALQIAGKKFERLTAIERAGQDRFGRAVWRCKCECGTEVAVAAFRLSSGHTRSCGCLTGRGNATHGKSRTGAHRSWLAMKARCLNPRSSFFARYGGRGITVCAEWADSFEAFFADMGERPLGATLDRIDTDSNYCPTNCRWATVQEQQNNRSTSIRICRDGRTMTVMQWCRELNIKADAVYGRIRRGIAPEEALHA